ncbi:hypothetical protein P4234_27715 [Pseudomonas aeruginosa]|nr:hypothetical protein [Pseudomonas aeruginosa]
MRLLSSDFVLPGKKAPALAGWARARPGCRVARPRLGIGEAPAASGWTAATSDPRHAAADRSRQVEQALGERLQGGTQHGSRRRRSAGFRQPPAALGGRLVGYANGGEANLRQLFEAVRRWHAGLPVDALPAPQPGAGRLLSSRRTGAVRRPRRLPGWGASRWASDAPRIAFLIPRGADRGARHRRHRRTFAA